MDTCGSRPTNDVIHVIVRFSLTSGIQSVSCRLKATFTFMTDILKAYKQAEILDHDSSHDNTNHSESVRHSEITRGDSKALSAVLERINEQEINGEYGAKLDCIIRHIRYIKLTTNGKCIVFSQFPKVIEMLKHGLERNQIKCMTLTTGKKRADASRFQEDPEITVILLHSRSHSR